MLGASFPRIQTVTGAVPASEVTGPILPHEHLRTDTRWGIGVPSDPHRWLDEERYVVAEIRDLGLEHGLGLVVEHTCLGMGRDPAALVRISSACRVPVVAATGIAPEPFSAELIRPCGLDDLTAGLLREIGAGFDGSGVRPGLIVASCWGEAPTKAEERAILAAARAARRSGLPVVAHGMEPLELLLSHGVPPHRLCGVAADVPAQRKIAETGAYVSVREAEHVLALLEAGHGERVLLSSGVSRRDHLAGYGGHGYGRLFDTLIPALGDAGVGEGTIRLITRENPVRWLAG